jgi:hypothetical protein
LAPVLELLLKVTATFAAGRLLFLCLDYFQQQWYDDCKNHQYNAQEFKITHKLSPLSAKIFLGFCVIGGYRPSGEGQPSTVYGDTLVCIVHLFVIKRKCFVKNYFGCLPNSAKPMGRYFFASL